MQKANMTLTPLFNDFQFSSVNSKFGVRASGHSYYLLALQMP